ncbi:periplasmic phosphate binding protein-like protein [Naegleria gruberi]|uniref:Periplasmic phosphate binding protein-like protein n=1 Tax=Naegleria gruberi TaxID=5762 RepID=D2VSL9_NAEGR|nr:periplasmic phosphate binding protein-like protein [Naegleria gruberi]EFC40147.1 periplasmic phosphate binding protein-like protein [Naegleria gruberi]|eukprot:XP_002672891.1 periplasmic phosphate binding protein-like protein [Naegleria gruberi strain NEG-M]
MNRMSRAYFQMWRCEGLGCPTTNNHQARTVVSSSGGEKDHDWRRTNSILKLFNLFDRNSSNSSGGYKYCKNNFSMMMISFGVMIMLLMSLLNSTSFVNAAEVPLLLGSGSSLVEEFHKEAANYFIGYMRRSVDVMYDASGSGTGVKNLFNSNGVYSFAATDYGLKAADRKINTDAKVLPIMTTYISIISNIEGLKGGYSITFSQEALVGIFNGTISRWNDQTLQLLNPSLALPNTSIYVVVRNDSSGTTDMLTTGLSSFSKEWASTYGSGTLIKWSSLLSNRIIYAEDAKDVSFIITSTPNTIGYSTPTTFEQHAPATIKTKLGASVTPSSSYLKGVITSGISFNENFMHPSVVIDRPDIYPFVGVSYIVYLSSTMNDCVKATYLGKLLEYYTSDRATKIIEDAAFSSLFIDASVKERYMGYLKNFTCNGKPVLSSSSITQYSIALLILLIIQLLCIL